MRDAIRVIALEVDIPQLCKISVVIVVVPRHHEATISRSYDRRLMLPLTGRRIDLELISYSSSIGTEALRENAPTATVLNLRLPSHDITTTIQTSHRRRLLHVQRVGIDLKLSTDTLSGRRIPLAVDSCIGTVLPLGTPDDNVTAIGQRGTCSLILRARPIGIDHFVAKQSLRPISLWGHIDRHQLRFAGRAIAVADADANRAAGARSRRIVAIGQVLDNRFHRIGAGAGIKTDYQIATVGAAQFNDADRRAAIRDVASRNTHLPCRRALVANSQLILSTQVIGQLLVAIIGIRRNNANPQATTIEVGGIGIAQTNAGVNQLRGGVDQVFGKGDAGCNINQHRRRGVRNAASSAENAVEYTVCIICAAFPVVAGPGYDKIVAVQANQIGLDLSVGHHAIDDKDPVDAVAGCIELLGNDVVAAAAQRIDAFPTDGETTIAKCRHSSIGAVVGRGINRTD